MTSVPRMLGFAIALGLGTLSFAPGFAQETTTTPEPAPAEVVPGDGATTDGLSMGTEVDTTGIATAETAVVGQTYVAARFDLWEQRCAKAADGSDPCQFYQLLKDKDGNPVAEISMFALAEGAAAAAGATIIVPLETLLTANLQLSIDGGKAKIYPFTFCTTQGCVSRVGFTADEVEQFRKGAGAVLTIVPAVAPDQKVELSISLKGFTAGYAAVTKVNLADQ